MKLMVSLGCLVLVGGLGLAKAESPVSDTNKAGPATSDSHLVAWWKLDETAGKTAADSSGQNHPGTLEGGLAFDTQSVASPHGNALKFDGKEGCVEIKGFKGITGSRPRTLVVWIKTQTPSGDVVSWGENRHGALWALCFIRSGLGVTPGGGYLYMKPGVEDNAWHQVAVVVREGSPPNLHDDVKLYKDGEPAEIDDIGLLDLWPIQTGDKQDVRLGWHFKGRLRDVRLYDRPFSENEIQTLFRATANKPKAKP